MALTFPLKCQTVSCTKFNTIRQEKKKIERKQLETFKECYRQFPIGEIEHEDRPDFRVHTEENIYGIEHTRIFRPISEQGIILQEQESLKNDTIKKANDIYHNSGDYPNLIVDVSFKSHYGLELRNYDTKLTKNKVNDLAKKIAELVIGNIPQAGYRIKLPHNNPLKYKKLPNEIQSVIISRDLKYKSEIWEFSAGTAVPELTSELIQKRISKKNGDTKKYVIDCDYNWLLIVEDKTGFSTYFDLEKEDFFKSTYNTDFDKVFLLRMRNCKVFDLNINS